MSKQVFPQAPSPTMTSLRRNSAMVADGVVEEEVRRAGWIGLDGVWLWLLEVVCCWEVMDL